MITLRNLFYSVYATRHTEEWRLNVDMLLSHADVFNGRKIVVVRSDDLTHTPAEVEKAFAGLENVEFIHRTNNPKLGEVEGFVEDFRRLRSLRADEMTFYAHTKGVRYPATYPSMPLVRNWRNAMYETCLGLLDEVQEAMRSNACVGLFKNADAYNKHGWHYAGNYWWVRHDALFTQPWEKVQQDRYGVERCLGDVLPRGSAFCLRFENTLIARGVFVRCGPCRWVYKQQFPTWGIDYPGLCSRCGRKLDIVSEESPRKPRAVPQPQKTADTEI